MSKKEDKKFAITCTGKGCLSRGHVVGYAMGPTRETAWKRLQKSTGFRDSLEFWWDFIEVPNEEIV